VGRDLRASAGARERAQRNAGRRRGQPLIWWTATSRLRPPTGCGWPTLPTFRRGRGFCIWLWRSMRSAGGWWGGRWPLTCGPSWFWVRSTWRCISAGPGPSSTTPTRARSTPRLPSEGAAGRRACVPPWARSGTATTTH
jgi:hypothetical protein